MGEKAKTLWIAKTMLRAFASFLALVSHHIHSALCSVVNVAYHRASFPVCVAYFLPGKANPNDHAKKAKRQRSCILFVFTLKSLLNPNHDAR